MKKFADLHCHNHARAYIWLKTREAKMRRRGQYTPWTVISSNRRRERKAGQGAGYSQADYVRCWNGGTRLTFNSIYPLEKGFFQTPSEPARGKNQFIKEIIRLATHHDIPLRDILQVGYMRIPNELVDHIQSDEYDYWKDMHHELDFVLIDKDKKVHNKIYTPGVLRQIFESNRKRRRENRNAMDATGIVRVPQSNQELRASLSEDAITMVLTIEGAHALGGDTTNFNTISRRVTEIKTQWPAPVFFITFAHHFDNHLCGHAHSLPGLGNLFLNQDDGLNGGFNDQGRKIIRKFLSLNSNNEKDSSLGYRILIDVKHMSALSRQQFYEEIVTPCLEKGDIIPVIASHCGYSGIETLDDHIENQELEDDHYTDISGQFNAWNINMCDEDIKMIFKTGGLFGLSFDQRILGVPKAQKEAGGRNTIKGLWLNIRGVLKVIYDDDQIPQNKKKDIWNRITIGTDFEGFIDPINKYKSNLAFSQFRDDLITTINEERKLNPKPNYLKHLKFNKDVEIAVDRICYGNAEEFVREHFMSSLSEL